MKKLLFLIVAMFSANVNAQFVLKPEGLLTSDGKDYIVHEVPGKTQAELYKLCKNSLFHIYNSAKDVMSENENESISIMGTSTNDVYDERNIFGQNTKYYVNVSYKFTIMFKDGRMRISAPKVVKAYQYSKENGTTDFIFGCGTNYASGPHYIFKKNGEERTAYDYKRTYEEFANNLVNAIINGLKKIEEPVEDW